MAIQLALCARVLRRASLERERENESAKSSHLGLPWLPETQQAGGLRWVARVTQTCGLRWFYCCLGLFLVPASAAGEAPGMKAELSCRAEAAPGRVLCELKYSASSGARLVWADALVTAAPDFVRPLRSRVTPERFAAAGSAERKLTLAFVAAKSGTGKVTVRARAVVCRGLGEQERCRPESQDARAEIRVGS
jgi:hypothetical protein